jgi:hypothetical protein
MARLAFSRASRFPTGLLSDEHSRPFWLSQSVAYPLAQQAAERALKAFLYHAGILTRYPVAFRQMRFETLTPTQHLNWLPRDLT